MGAHAADAVRQGEPVAARANRRGAQLARSALARGAGFVERLARDLRGRLLDADAGDEVRRSTRDAARHGPGLKYGRHWVPSDQRTARLAIYNSDDETTFEEGGQRDAERVGKYVTPASVVLDFGCGSGRVARYVAPHCAELWAVDASPRMLELARERLGDSTNLRFARCHDVKIPDVASESVDVVYSFLVLQHLEREDAFLALRELRRVLRPGGTAVLTFPNLLDDSYLEGFVRYALAGEVANEARARIYTPQEVERVLPAAGFSLVDVESGSNIIATCRPDG